MPLADGWTSVFFFLYTRVMISYEIVDIIGRDVQVTCQKGFARGARDRSELT